MSGKNGFVKVEVVWPADDFAVGEGLYLEKSVRKSVLLLECWIACGTNLAKPCETGTLAGAAMLDGALYVSR